MKHSVSAMFLLTLLLFLPSFVNCQLAAIFLDTDEDNKTGSISYLAELNLALQPGASPNKAKFLLDLNAHQSVLSYNCTRKTNKAELWSLLLGDDGIVASTADNRVGNINVVCKKKHGKNIAALSSHPSSLPSQVVSHLKGRPLRFATVLRSNSGTVYFGRNSWVQYIQIAPSVKAPVTFVNIPLTLAPSGGYSLELTGVSYKASLPGQKFKMEMSTTEPFTTLPSKAYNFLLGQFNHEAVEKKISQVPTGYGKLTRCYSMKDEDRKSFHNATMVFSSKFQWSVSGKEYLVQKPGSGNIFCFAYVETTAGTSGVIGTRQQLDRVVEYRLDTKTLAVSLPLVGALISP